MKRYILLIGFLILTSACSVVDNFTKFNMDFNQSATIPASSLINTPIDITLPDIQTNSVSTFEINETNKDLIEEVKLTSLIMQISAPSNSNFSFLEHIEIFMVADGLPELKIAYKEGVSNSIGSELTLDVSDNDLKEYIKKDVFKIRIRTIFDEVLDSDHTIDMKSVFFVDAKILGV